MPVQRSAEPVHALHGPAPSLLTRLVQRAGQDRLVRTAGPLVVNTVTNGVLGVLFWIVAARQYAPGELAQGSAMVSAMTTLSGLCQLNMAAGLAALLPRSGNVPRMIVQTYLVVTGFSLLILPLFAFLVLPRLSDLSEVLAAPSTLLLFTGAVLVHNLFALQDAALVAQRWGRWIPTENAVFGVAKLALLVVLAASIPGLGVFVSWLVPMLVLVPVVSGSVLVAARRQKRKPAAPLPSRRGTARELGLDYVGYLFLLCSSMALPVVAFELLEPGAAAVFSIAWMMCASLDLFATNVGTALTVEASHGHDLAALLRTALHRVLPLIGAVVVAVVVAAPWVLQLFGSGYSSEGTTTLRILALSTLPRAIATMAVAEARASRDMGFILWIRVLGCVAVLGLAFLLAPSMGAPGVATAWLVAQALSAVAAGLRFRRLVSVPSRGA